MARHIRRYPGSDPGTAIGNQIYSQRIVIRKGLNKSNTISSVTPRREGDVPKKGNTCGSAGHKDEG